MANDPLGRLTQVALHDTWAREATDFTPWLAREENLAVLSEAIGIELEFEAQEKAVGPFRADILCKEAGTGAWVLIENQLERTDHLHLGQLLTYASGLDAATIIWIAARFTDEHRSTLDWLNRITAESFRFFGAEVELWRIGDSPAAPRFNVVSKPNDWSKSVARAARAIDETELSSTRALQLAYWTAFQPVLMATGGFPARKAQPQSWMGYSIGRGGFNLAAVIVRPKRQVRAELYISNPAAKAYFHLLKTHAEAIHHDLGYSLNWEELPDGRDSRVSIALTDTDVANERDWPRQHHWLAQRLLELRRVLADRVRALDASQWQPPLA